VGGDLAQFSRRGARVALLTLAATAASLCLAAEAHASTPFTPGDVVVYRLGEGSEPLEPIGTSVILNEFEPSGVLATTYPLPTSPTTGAGNKAFVDSGSAGSDGLMTLSGDGECLLAVGYDTALKTLAITATKASTVPRTVAVIKKSGEIDTTTALTDFANENNARSATSSDCSKLWVGGAGKGTTGGVHFVEKLGATKSTLLNKTTRTCARSRWSAASCTCRPTRAKPLTK